MKLKLLFLSLTLLTLVACSSQAAATPLPTVVLNGSSQASSATPSVDSGGGGMVAASGVVAPKQEAQLAFTLGGTLKTINVVEGDQVTTGQILAELDSVAIQLQLDQAKRELMELTSPAAAADAEQTLAAARKALDDQQDKVDAQFYRRASDTLIEKTEGEIVLAQQTLSRASDSYKVVARLEDGDSRKAAALVAMTNAQLRLNDLKLKLNWYTGKPTDIDAAIEKAKLDVAKAAVQEAEWYLSELKGETIPAEATGSNLTRLEAARNALAAAQDQLDHTRLISPIPGTVVKVNKVAGELVSPGELIFSVSDVAVLHIETTDLSERDVPSVKVGQSVMVSIKALNTSAPGHVVSISPVANILGGDVVYKTTIDLDTVPEGLLAGMSVDVQYNVGQ